MSNYINHHINVNSAFSEAVYQQMVSKRYGISFCCQSDLKIQQYAKEVLSLTEQRDINLIPSLYQGTGEFAPCEFAIDEVTEPSNTDVYLSCNN